ncbi:hypothetical protein AEA09_12030 [Lysinibacillus contaminans]|uniref:DUF3021 domain-containing protein n=1 Tax=Lysinibacillus contaminans TaxID=1293441 RepID=A0ABR5K368_9BACI|nr:DUF3021 domain-containing protein [Lysinibacillus contaminans]KOS69204.1 hypothetical protein AEA09_12030 [Lysinibacillus contaminans]
MHALRMMIIGLLISLSSSYVLMSLSVFSKPNAVMSGAELLEQIAIAAVMGIVIGLISLILESERLPFTVLLCIHFIAIIICVLIAGYFGQWYDISDISTIVGVLFSVVIIYIITWCIIRVLLKRDIQEINKSIQKRRGTLR